MHLLVVSLLLPYTIDFGPVGNSESSKRNIPHVAEEAGLVAAENDDKRKAGLRHSRDPVSLVSSPDKKENIKSSPIPDLLSTVQTGRPVESQNNTNNDELFFNSKTNSPAPKSPPLSHLTPGPDEEGSSPAPIAGLSKPVPFLKQTVRQPPLKSQETAPPKSVVEPRKKTSPPSTPSVRFLRRKPISQRNSLSSPGINRFHRPPFETFDESAWNVELQTGGNGGLRNAVRRACETDPNLKVHWIGTLGMPTDALTEDKRKEIASAIQGDEYNCLPVFVKDSTAEGHYMHYCKQILWPTLHYEIPDNPKSKAYEDHSWVHYKAMNQKIADKVVEKYQEGTIVWVNDYHLMLVPQMVRKKLPCAKIGFFMHIPFPSSEVFRCLPARKQLLEGMLGANCIGFQIHEYARHFLQTCNRLLAADTEANGIWYDDRPISVIDISIGIDPSILKEYHYDKGVSEWRHILRKEWPYNDVKLIVSRDKLDPIRGIKQKLLAYEEFLKKHPDLISKTVLIQVCLTSVEDASYEQEITFIVDRINSMKHDLAAHMPVVFYHQDILFQQYFALLCEADVFCVTSLREGMNLTCHEFIYCNDTKIMGPLILSEFTGSASVLSDGCILVNPWDRQQMEEAFYQAVTMNKEDRHRRWACQYDYVSKHTCLEWISGFLEKVETAWNLEQERNANKGHILHEQRFAKDYSGSGKKSKRLFFLDLDTMDPFLIRRRLLTGSGATTAAKPSRSNSSTNLNALAKSQSQAALSTLEAKTANGDTASGSATPSDFNRSSQPHDRPDVSPQRKILVLSELTSDPANLVYVMSRGTREELDRVFGRVPLLGFIAENGAYVKHAGGNKEWQDFAGKEKTAHWREMVVDMLHSFMEREPSLRIKVQDSSVNLYVDQLLEQEPERARAVIGQCVSHINDGFSGEHIRARLQEGKKVVISDADLGRAEAANQVCKDMRDSIDDIGLVCIATKSDEDVDDAEKLNDWAHSFFKQIQLYTISLGTRATNATWSMSGTNSLLLMLYRTSRGMTGKDEDRTGDN